MSRWVVVLSLGAGLFVMGAQVRAQALEKSALGSWGVQGTLAKAPGATCAAGKSTRGTSGPRGMGQKAPGATCAAGKSGPGGVGNEREAGPETTWHGRRWTLEAGIGVFGSHALSEFRHDAVGVAGWVGVGGEHIRVEVDYWHQQRREEYVESFELFGGTLENRTTELRIKKQYHVLVSRRFAVGRGIVPHVAIGGGYGGNQGYRCHETRGVFEASRVCQRWTADAFVATGAGLDVLLGTRLFARVQTRGLIGAADDHYGTWESVLRAAMAWVVVTGGVRF